MIIEQLSYLKVLINDYIGIAKDEAYNSELELIKELSIYVVTKVVPGRSNAISDVIQDLATNTCLTDLYSIIRLSASLLTVAYDDRLYVMSRGLLISNLNYIGLMDVNAACILDREVLINLTLLKPEIAELKRMIGLYYVMRNITTSHDNYERAKTTVISEAKLKSGMNEVQLAYEHCLFSRDFYIKATMDELKLYRTTEFTASANEVMLMTLPNNVRETMKLRSSFNTPFAQSVKIGNAQNDWFNGNNFILIRVNRVYIYRCLFDTTV